MGKRKRVPRLVAFYVGQPGECQLPLRHSRGRFLRRAFESEACIAVAWGRNLRR